MENLFTGLITSKTRIKLLIKFFLNPNIRSYLRELSKELKVSTNSVRQELNQLTNAKLLKSQKNGRQIFYTANREHPLFPELISIARKTLGIDHIIDDIVMRLGDLERAYLIDDYANGKDTGVIDLLLVGNIDQYHLNDLSRKTEKYINRKIRSLVVSRKEFKELFLNPEERPRILIWETKKK